MYILMTFFYEISVICFKKTLEIGVEVCDRGSEYKLAACSKKFIRSKL